MVFFCSRFIWFVSYTYSLNGLSLLELYASKLRLVGAGLALYEFLSLYRVLQLLDPQFWISCQST